MKIAIIALMFFAIGWGAIRFVGTKPMRDIFSGGSFIALALVTLAGFLLTNSFVFFGVCFLSSVIFVRSRLEAVCRFVVLVVLVPNISMPLRVGGAYIGELRPMIFFLLGFGVMTLVHRARGPGLRRGITAEDLAIAIFTLLFAFAMNRADSSTGLARQVFIAVTGFALPYFLLTRSISGRAQLGMIVMSVAGTGLMLALISVYEARHAWSIFDTVWRNLAPDGYITRNVRMRGGLLRAPTTFMDSTTFALFETTAFFAILSARAAFRSELFWRLACCVMVVGLLTPQSRAAQIATAVSYGVVLLFRRTYGRSVAFFGAIALAGAVLVVTAQSNERLAAFTQSTAAVQGDDYRQLIFKRGVEEGKKHFWFGEDVNDVVKRMPDLIQGEHIVDLVNSYLILFLGGGIIGLTAFLLPIGAVFPKLWRATGPKRRSPTSALDTYLVGSFVSVLIVLAFTSLVERNPFWLLLALACSKIVTRSREEVEMPSIAGRRSSKPQQLQPVAA